MSRIFTRPQKVLAFALVTTGAMAFTPSKWLGWTGDIANIINMPLTPFRDLGTAVGSRLRSPDTHTAGLSAAERTLLEERDEWERQYHLAALRVRELEDQIEQLQHLPPDNPLGRTRPVAARITGRNVRDILSPVEINRGERHEVSPGAIAVYGGVHLLGQVTSVEPLRSHVLPITNTSLDLIRARLLPQTGGAAITAGELVILKQAGDGTFTADVRDELPVVQGDIVRLDDDYWPPAAQALIIGYVESITRNDRQPVMKTITVRPRHQLHQLAAIALRVPLDEETPMIGRGGASR